MSPKAAHRGGFFVDPHPDTTPDIDTLVAELTTEIMEGLEHILQAHADFDLWCHAHDG